MKLLTTIIFFIAFLTTSWSQDLIQDYFRLTDKNVKLKINSWTEVELEYPLARDITDKDFQNFNVVADFIRRHPGFIYELGYHTSTAPIPLTNDTLSRLASNYIKEFLVVNCHIDTSIIKTKSYVGTIPFILPYDTIKLGFKFYKGTILTDEYISKIVDKKKKRAAYSLNQRVILKVIGVKNE